MSEKVKTKIEVGAIVFLKSDTNFNLPMIVKSLPDSNILDVHLVWIGSQKTVVRGFFPLEALITKPTDQKQ